MSAYLFESIMLICFGVSWPMSIAKALRTRFVRGKSPLFMSLIIIGYASGVTHKIFNPPPPDSGLANYVIWLYAFNFVVVSIDLILYFIFRNNPEKIKS